MHQEHSQPGLRNDLWRYSQGTWTLMHDGQSADTPPARQLAAACGLDKAYFVLFGGLGAEEESQSTDGDSVLGDIWIFSIDSKQWFTLDDFQTKIKAHKNNQSELPAARGDMAFWCNSGETLTVFGGFGENETLHSDLWTFNLKTLQWQLSAQSESLPKDQSFVSYLDYPTARSGATTWTTGDRLFLWGGNILPKNARKKHLMIGAVGDMWEYSLSTDTWTYITGSKQLCRSAGVYGELGAADKNNQPGCRRKAAAWVDVHNNLWMFGGDGIDSSQESVTVFKHSKLLSDIWYFELKTSLWTWKGGSNKGEGKGVYKTQGEQSSESIPGSRCEAVVWYSAEMNSEERRERRFFYLFGGIGHDSKGQDGYLNDIWKLDTNFDSSVFRNVPYAGPVFTVIIIGLSLVVFVIVIYAFTRRFYSVKEVKTTTKYTKIPQDIDVESLDL